MPQVAFDAKIHVQDPLPRLARPAQQSDRAPSPFESLLDVGTQAADQSPPPPPPENKVTPADNSQAPVKNADRKPVTANDDTPTKPDSTDPTVKLNDNGKPAVDDKADAKAKTDAAAGDDIKTADNTDTPGDGPKTDNPAAPSPTDGAQSITTANTATLAPVIAVVSDQAPVPNSGDQPTLPQGLTAIAANATIDLKAFDPASKAGAGKQIDPGKKTDDGNTQVQADPSSDETTAGLQLNGKVTPQSQVGKPQPAASDNDGDKEHVAQARGEVPAKGHQIDTDGPRPVSAGDASVTTPKTTADTAQPAVLNTSQITTSAPSTPASTIQPPPLAAAIPLAGLAVDIAGKALAGKNRFEIRLDPPELGRIEVRLDVDRDGNVTSRLTVDRPDTLDLLRRDASGLERALQDAGLKTADNGLQFSLRDQSMSQEQSGNGSDTAQIVVKDETLPPLDVIPQNYGRLAGQGGGLDIRV